VAALELIARKVVAWDTARPALSLMAAASVVLKEMAIVLVDSEYVEVENETETADEEFSL
jgi:hypothetical protein